MKLVFGLFKIHIQTTNSTTIFILPEMGLGAI